MKALKKMFAAALAATLPLAGLAADEPAKPAENAPAAAPAPAPAPAPAAAPVKPTFTLYGTLNANLQTTKAYGGATTVRARNAVSIDSSNIGIRGGLTLNPMLGATFQCETGASIDGISPASLCNRNSRLGLTGTWGTLFFGNWDTPYKAATYGTKADDPFMNTDVWDFANIMHSPGFNYRSGAYLSGTPSATSNAVAGFDNRAQNSVGYHSPKVMGLSAKLQYSANEFKNAGGTVNPELYSVAVNWDYGPVSVLFSYQRHEDAFALNAITAGANANNPVFGSTSANALGSSSTDFAWIVGAGVDVPWVGVTTVGGLYEQLTLEENFADTVTAGIKRYTRPAWQISLKHRIGPHELRARYNSAGKGKYTPVGGAKTSADGYGAMEYAVGYAYHFTPALQAYVHWTQLKNDKNAQYTLSIGGSPAVAGTTPKGADPQALGLGLRMSF